MPTPKWYFPVVVLALLWNLLGCAAYLADVTVSAETLAKMTPEQQALHAARPAWAVAATATAVWGGAAGCIALLLRRRWATPLLALSLAGIVVQDFALFVLARDLVKPKPAAFILQALVLAVGVGLVALARTASARGWMKAPLQAQPA